MEAILLIPTFRIVVQWRALPHRGSANCKPFLRLIFQPYTGGSFHPFDEEVIMTPTNFTLNVTETLNPLQYCLRFSHDTNQ